MPINTSQVTHLSRGLGTVKNNLNRVADELERIEAQIERYIRDLEKEGVDSRMLVDLNHAIDFVDSTTQRAAAAEGHISNCQRTLARIINQQKSARKR